MLRRGGRTVVLAVLAAVVVVTGASPATRLVGGNPIAIQSAPWAVLVTYGTSSTDFNCGGSIIDASLVLTSAYCLYDSSGSLEPTASLTVTAGVSNYVTPASDDDEQTRSVIGVRIHPGFEYNAGAVQPDDLAVLTLSAPLQLGGTAVQAVALPSPSAPFPSGASATIASFGQESQSASASGQLAAVPLTVDPQGECGQASTSQYLQFNAVELCGVSPAGGICDGDGGSGLVTTSGTPVLIGVADGSYNSCTAGSQDVFAYAGAPEVLDFIQGNNNPPTVPKSSEADPTKLEWYGTPITGSTLFCTTGGWGGGVTTSYSFLNATTGQVLQSGPSGGYLVPASAVGTEIECASAVTNAGGTTLVHTQPAPAIKPAAPTPRGCDVTQKASIRGTVAAKIDFVNDISVPVKIYWLNYKGKRVYYETLAPGRSVTQPTFVTDPWIVLAPSGTCVGYVVAPHSKYVIGA